MNDQNPLDRQVDSRGRCFKCGGTHYGSYMCPITDNIPKNDHVHSDACWEPDSGCDMGRSDEHAVAVPASEVIPSKNRLTRSERRRKEIERLRRDYDAAIGAGAKELAESQRLRGALSRLVTLKNYKDAHGKTEYYEAEQPEAWAQAREALSNARYGDRDPGVTKDHDLARAEVERCPICGDDLLKPCRCNDRT